MLLLVVKSRYTTVLGEHFGFDRFMVTQESLWRSDLVLYAPTENRFILFSRDPKTGLRVTTSQVGNLEGRRHAKNFVPSGLDSNEALLAVADMLKYDATPPLFRPPLNIR